MTDRATILALIADLEKAEEPMRELDARIWWIEDRKAATVAYWNAALGKPTPLGDEYPGGWGILTSAPRLTGSTDLALSTVPEGWTITVLRRLPSGLWMVFIQQPGRPMEALTGDGHTLPLAILIASLRARLADMENANG